MSTDSKFKCYCGNTEDVTYAPCPYASEIHGDYTEVYMCEKCRDNAEQDI